MFLTNQNSEIVACILLFRKALHKPNLESSSKYGFPPIWGKNGRVLSMRMQVILNSLFTSLGSASIGGPKKGEFRGWTRSSDIFLPGPDEHTFCRDAVDAKTINISQL